MNELDNIRLTHSRSGLPCTVVLPNHYPVDGKGVKGPAVCSSHVEHVELKLPHVCCCGFIVELEDGGVSNNG